MQRLEFQTFLGQFRTKLELLFHIYAVPLIATQLPPTPEEDVDSPIAIANPSACNLMHARTQIVTRILDAAVIPHAARLLHQTVSLPHVERVLTDEVIH